MDNAQLINQDSGNVEYYTQSLWVELARQVMGDIELDPASCPVANKTVKAHRYFTKEDDAFKQDWTAKTLWMNHPFSRSEKACVSNCKKVTCKKRGYCVTEDKPGNREWIQKLNEEFEAGRVQHAINICFASTSESWFEPLLHKVQCYPYGRTNYNAPDGTLARGVTKSSVINLWTRDEEMVARFAEVFSPYGAIKVEYKPN